jgi:pimeloyl-ACP methyl ester carboxylesterase
VKASARTAGTLLAVGSLFVATASALPASAATTSSALVWGPCPKAAPSTNAPITRDPREVCATLTVPLDYANKTDHRTIKLTISKIPSTNPHPKELLVEPGGPGEPGLDEPSRWSALPTGAALLGTYDLIGADDRGIGNSTPVDCDLSPADLDFTVAVPYPAPDGDISANVAQARRVAQACETNAGAYLPYLTTSDIARDTDSIRAALGVPKISYYGVSYGTYRGAVFASMFPSDTDKIVLDSVVNPGGTLPGIPGKAPGTASAFGDFATWAAQNDAKYHLGTTPQAVRAAYFRIAADLDRQPRTNPNGGVLTGNMVRIAMPSLLEVQATFVSLAALLDFGDGTRSSLPAGSLERTFPDNFESAQYAIICGDTPASGSTTNTAYYSAAVKVSKALYPLTDGAPSNIWPCSFWPSDAVHPAVHVSDTGPHNVMLLQNERDPSAWYGGALQMRAALGQRATMVSVDAEGHGVNQDNPCVASTLTSFLLDGRLPKTDTRCPAIPH